MKNHTVIKCLVILCLLYSPFALASPCDGEEKNFIHCVDTNMTTDLDVTRHVLGIYTAGPYQYGYIHCALSDIFDAAYTQYPPKPGDYSTSYFQCNNATCNSQIPLSTDNITFNADKTSTPFKHTIPVNMNFGESCNEKVTPDLHLSNVCMGDYCASTNNATGVNKIIKFVTGDNSLIYCGDSAWHVIMLFTNEKDNRTLSIYQCDNFQCLNPKLLATDEIKIDPKTHKPDHAKFSVTMDPSFGENCSPYPKGFQPTFLP